jgi:hypothetical protein
MNINTYELTVTNSAGNSWVQTPVTVVASTQYTFSFYAKQGTATEVKYSVFDNNGFADIVAATSYFAQINPSDYTRVSVTFTTPVGCTSIRAYPERDNGVTGTVRVAAAQLELGAIATNWELTTGSPGVKNLLQWSQEISASPWQTFGGVTIAQSPDTLVLGDPSIVLPSWPRVRYTG